jgi:hypothetical protein
MIVPVILVLELGLARAIPLCAVTGEINSNVAGVAGTLTPCCQFPFTEYW